MSETLRLGDLVDDFCPRCKLLLNHAVASMWEGQVVKVICKTCYSEHAYRHGEGGKKPVSGRVTLFDQVLAKATPAADNGPGEAPAKAAKVAKKKAPAAARYITRHRTRPKKS